MDDTLAARWAKKFRALTLTLIFSGALNIALLGAVIFSSFDEKGGSPAAIVPRGSSGFQDSGLSQTLLSMSKLSFRELVSSLTNLEPAEEGFLKRDLAIAALASFHHFNLEKALSGSIEQRRQIPIADDRVVEIFPGLKDDHFQAIIKYAYEEKWPLTTLGLFEQLKKSSLQKDESLVNAFIATPQFYALQTLFQKSGSPQETPILVDLALEGSWDLLERLFREQEQMLDFSKEKRERILLSYLRLKSPTSAKILLKTDFSFALKKLSDPGILVLLNLINDGGEESRCFCTELLRSPRTDAVWKLSAQKLYSFQNESLPEPFDLQVALVRFAPGKSLKTEAPVAVLPKKALVPTYQIHVVKEGDSLWKIARQHKVKVDELVKLNQLEKDRLVPGMTLRLPLDSL